MISLYHWLIFFLKFYSYWRKIHKISLTLNYFGWSETINQWLLKGRCCTMECYLFKVMVLHLEYLHKLREFVNTLKLISNLWIFVFFWELRYSFHWIIEGLYFLTSKRLKTVDLKSRLYSFYDNLSYFSYLVSVSYHSLLRKGLLIQSNCSIWNTNLSLEKYSCKLSDTWPALKQHYSIDLSVMMEMFKMFDIYPLW